MASISFVCIVVLGPMLATSVKPFIRREEIHGRGDIDTNHSVDTVDFGWLQKLKDAGFAPHGILDVGANRGDWTREAKKTYPDANFILFDGTNHSSEWKDLMDKGSRGLVSILSDKPGEVDWYEGGDSTGNSMHKERTHFYDSVGAVKRSKTTLDSALEQLKRPDETFELLKMDVQGAEPEILKGASETLKHVEVILLELPFAGQYNSGSMDFRGYVDLLSDLGYEPYDKVEDHNWGGHLIQIDFVYAKKGSKLLEKLQEDIHRS